MADEIGIIKKKICVWGTGTYSKKFYNELLSYNQLIKYVFDYDLEEHIVYFIDNDITKQNKIFCEKKIVSAETFWQDSYDECVLAFLHTKEVEESFATYTNKRCIRFDCYLDKFKADLLSCSEKILLSIGIDYKIEKNYKALKKYCEKHPNYSAKTLLVIMSLLVYQCLPKGRILEKDIKKIAKELSLPQLIASLAWIKGKDIECLVDYAKQLPLIKSLSQKETVGIVLDRYYGGGIERVISILIKKYTENGHKVVILVNERNEDIDYPLPDGVMCHIMKWSASESQLSRLNELADCVEKYDIDIMCFHSGYLWINTFYEMLLIRCMQRAVIMELHTSYPQLEMSFSYSAQKYAYMYSIANKVVVLSEQDKNKWKSLGVDCVYIPNPTMDFKEEIKQVIRKEETESPVILWVGRLVQKPKNVLDVIPIMRDVIKVYPKAKLKLVGSKDREYEYNLLVDNIRRYNLENNIEICGYHKIVDDFYKVADVFLFTSSYESFSQVIIESKQWGLPMVMYEIPWLELTRSGRGYMAVSQGDTVAAANAIIKLLDDVEYRKKMGEEARKSVEEFLEFDVYNAWREIFGDIYGG